MFGYFHWLEGSLPTAHPEMCWVLHRESGSSSSSCKTTSSGGRVSVDRDSSTAYPSRPASEAVWAGLALPPGPGAHQLS